MPLGSDGNFDGTQGSKEVVIASVRRTGLSLPPFENGCKTAVGRVRIPTPILQVTIGTSISLSLAKSVIGPSVPTTI